MKNTRSRKNNKKTPWKPPWKHFRTVKFQDLVVGDKFIYLGLYAYGKGQLILIKTQPHYTRFANGRMSSSEWNAVASNGSSFVFKPDDRVVALQ